MRNTIMSTFVLKLLENVVVHGKFILNLDLLIFIFTFARNIHGVSVKKTVLKCL